MLSTVQYFDLIRAKHNIHSDYALAQYLDISPGLISKHRKKSFGFGSDLGLKISESLKMDPAYVILCGIAESAKCTEEKAALTRLAFFAEMNATQLAYGWKGQHLD